MAKQKEKKVLSKKGCMSSFNLVGEAKLSDYTFNMDAESKSSDWIYNSLRLLVDCGEKCGFVNCELMGGYGAERENVLYVHGKDEDGRDDFKNQYTIDWEDRLDNDILKDIGDMCFITIGLEKDKDSKTVYKDFLSPYDAIAYVNEHLEEGMVINVKGNLEYSTYQGNTQCRKTVTSLVLSKAEPKNYHATFTQTILLDRDAIQKPDKGEVNIPIDGYVLDYVKEMNGVEVKGFVPFRKRFEFERPTDDVEMLKKAVAKLFKVKKGITQATFVGYFSEGATVNATLEDLTDDLKELVAMGIMSEEDALATCSDGTSRDRKMIIQKPYFKMEGDEDNKVPVMQITENVYEEDDLLLDCLIVKEEQEEEFHEATDEDEVPFKEEETETDDNDWLANL